MRIALCTQHLSDMTSLNILGNMARELSLRGHSPFLYTSDALDYTAAAARDLKSLRGLKTPIRQVPQAGARAMARRLAAAMRADNIDFVNVRLGGTHSNPLVCALPDALRSEPRIGFGLQFDDFGHPDLPKNCPRTARSISRLLNKARVSAVSRAVRDRIARYWPDKSDSVKVIGNGVDLDWAAQAVRAKTPPKTSYLLSTGRHCRYKGMDLLAFAFAQIAAEFPVDLVIAGPEMGNGQLRGLIDKLRIKNRVQLRGFTERDKLPGLLNGARFFVLASRWESFGMAALEAMAAGKAVIAPRVGGFIDYISHGKTGLLFSPNDPADLALAMRRLLRSPALASSLGAAARRSARRRSWSAITDQYLDLWFRGTSRK